MSPRANWKGHLKLGEINCAVSLHTAASTSERISFHMVNRRTGNRLNREFVDSETGKAVDREDQVKGYEVSDGRYVELEADEVADAVPEANKVLEIDAFIACADVDETYFERPYYLAPTDKASADVYALIRDGLAEARVAAIAQTVLFRRFRTVMIRAHGNGLVATTLNHDYEVRPAEEVFKDLPKTRIEQEMLELAGHIIETKKGRFDPSAFDDRYEAALADLVKAKIEGGKIKKPRPPKETKPSDLLEALRRSAEGDGKSGRVSKKKSRSGGAMRKAG